jgi:NAD/NADP transhydrogenase alpha subunit
MKVAVAAESDAGERRVAATPETVKNAIRLGANVALNSQSKIMTGISIRSLIAARSSAPRAPSTTR